MPDKKQAPAQASEAPRASSSRIKLILRLTLLLGVPVGIVLALFSSGVYLGATNSEGIVKFEDWILGEDTEGDEGDTEGGDAAETESSGSEDPEPKDPDPKDPEPKDPDPKDPKPKDPEPKDPEPEPKDPEPEDPRPEPVGVEGPVYPVASALAAPPGLKGALNKTRVVSVKVLVDRELIAAEPNWLAYTDGLLKGVSATYEVLFGISLRTYGVVEWDVPIRGVDSDELLEDLHGRSRDGADLLIGLTSRPLDGEVGGKADSAPADAPINGAYAVVYAAPKRQHPHFHTLLHELGHLFGATDVDRGGWMSYEAVDEDAAPSIDDDNRRRILEHKMLPFYAEDDAKKAAGEDK